MKKTRILFVQVFLVIVLGIFSVYLHTMKKSAYTTVGAFGNDVQNTEFSDLADRFYEMFS